MSLTAHCLIKNESKWIECALRSVLCVVDAVLVFDTGSTDGTVEIVKKIQQEFPGQVVLEEKGAADKARHTALRQEMVERTTTDWFMVLDGDEVWTKRGIEEVQNKITHAGNILCFIAPFYLCVGDVYHHSRRGVFTIQGKKMHATARVFKRTNGLHWSGEYGFDAVVDQSGHTVAEGTHVGWLENRFWHLTHLVRSTKNEYSSGRMRYDKLVPTYFLVGQKIKEPLPEVFLGKILQMSFLRSFLQFWPYSLGRVLRKMSGKK